MHTSRYSIGVIGPTKLGIDPFRPRCAFRQMQNQSDLPRSPFYFPFPSQALTGNRAHGALGHPDFTIRCADTPDCREGASRLIERRYGWRGYGQVGLPPESDPQRHTFAAVGRQDVLGTLTVALDGPEGLSCEFLFGDEVATLRAAGARVCEFTRLAVDAVASLASDVLTALFHAAYTLAHREGGFDTLLVEVHPRHVRYYQRMFGAGVLAAQRHHPGVNAPAVLLSLSLGNLAALAEAATAAR